jgi:hypothetical protein
MLEQNADSDTARAIIEMVEPHDGCQHSAVSRNLVAVRKCDDQPHSNGVMRHAAPEEKTVTRKIDHLSHVLNLGVPGIKRAYVNRQRYLQALSAACVASREMGVGTLPFFCGRGSVESVDESHIPTRLGAGSDPRYRTLVL